MGSMTINRIDFCSTSENAHCQPIQVHSFTPSLATEAAVKDINIWFL